MDVGFGPLKSTHAFPLKATFCTAKWRLRARNGQAVLPFSLQSSGLCVQSRSWRDQNRYANVMTQIDNTTPQISV